MQMMCPPPGQWGWQAACQDWNWGVACASPYEFTAYGNTQDGPKTTVMLRNLPNNYSRAMLLELLDAEGFVGTYDFVYLPIDFRMQASLGYAFVNFVTADDAEYSRTHLEGFSKWMVRSDKVMAVTWAEPHQGLIQHLERYRNSPVMHDSVPDEWKPVVFVGTERAPFPPPTQAIRKPKIRRRTETSQIENVKA
jgi:RNA recognition motif-containing protein